MSQASIGFSQCFIFEELLFFKNILSISHVLGTDLTSLGTSCNKRHSDFIDKENGDGRESRPIVVPYLVYEPLTVCG